MPDKTHAIVPDDLTEMASLKHWGELPNRVRDVRVKKNTIVDCGWGRLLFGQTFTESQNLANALQDEKAGERDVALYVREPHVVLSLAPHALFLDPSHTFRIDLVNADLPEFDDDSSPLLIREAVESDRNSIDAIYASRKMVPIGEDYISSHRQSDAVCILVVENKATKEIVGVVMGVDHRIAFSDPDNGSSLWALAVDTQAKVPRIGRTLVEALASRFRSANRSFMDLSVIHNNAQAIALYQSLGFEQIPAYCVKKKNPVNEKLFIGPASQDELNPYAQIIIDEARRRGIAVDVEDADSGLFKLSLGGRTINCRESLSDLTSAVALSRCDDKALTHRLLRAKGLHVPAQKLFIGESSALEFLEQYKRIVVKPAQGEQGRGVFVDLSTPDEVLDAIQEAKKLCDSVLMEEFVTGQDLRIIVIGGDVVAAAIRRPATIIGDGEHTIIELIDKQSRRRAAATRGESRIPFDAETERCVERAGYQLLDILPQGETLEVRRTANLHTGGTIHDVTADLHDGLAIAARESAEVVHMPVVGLDMIVKAPDKPEYRIIELNERPGLANHEPAPTAAKFIDLLFPETSAKANKHSKTS